MAAALLFLDPGSCAGATIDPDGVEREGASEPEFEVLPQLRRIALIAPAEHLA